MTTTPTKEQIKQAKLNLENAKKVVIQVAELLAAARKGNALQNETDEFMFIVARHYYRVGEAQKQP